MCTAGIARSDLVVELSSYPPPAKSKTLPPVTNIDPIEFNAERVSSLRGRQVLQKDIARDVIGERVAIVGQQKANSGRTSQNRPNETSVASVGRSKYLSCDVVGTVGN